jgi:hypothetical protein
VRTACGVNKQKRRPDLYTAPARSVTIYAIRLFVAKDTQCVAKRRAALLYGKIRDKTPRAKNTMMFTVWILWKICP